MVECTCNIFELKLIDAVVDWSSNGELSDLVNFAEILSNLDKVQNFSLKTLINKLISVSKISTCFLEFKMGKYSSLCIGIFKGGESTWKISIK